MKPVEKAPGGVVQSTTPGDYRWVGKPVPRVDAEAKVTGRLKYLTDLDRPGMLHGRVKRSDYPHAVIKNIDVSAARGLPGVAAVLTAGDVPGQNGFGIVVPDQPVLCRDKVRYLGDAVALVAAETPEAAAKALDLIRVEYEPLPVVDDPIEALKEGAPKVHEKGNLHSSARVNRGDVEKAFAEAGLIIENVYRSPRQMHTFLETEGGMAEIDGDGNITVWAGGQHPYRDQLQVARALGYNPKKIRIVNNPLGGAFGGKDEITVQIHLALLALHTKRPVKLWLSREESVVSGWKRHPMAVFYKTAFKRDGTLLANEVKIYGDTGAYASLGGPVVNLAIEHCCGPYRVPHHRAEGYCVYTNNGVAGAFRGFGANQVIFAMETQLDIAAEKLGIDRLEIRKMNALRRGDVAALGHTMKASVGVLATLEAAEKSELWQRREELKRNVAAPWKKRGIGVASELHGTGLGAGLPDYGAARIVLESDGTFTVKVSCPEIGQGNTTAYAQMAAEALGCELARVRVQTGDTDLTPDSGTSTASRSIYTGGNAIVAAAEKMKAKLVSVATERLEASIDDLARYVYDRGLDPAAVGSFVWPTAGVSIEGAFGLPHLIYTYITQVALVEVDTLTGRVEVVEAFTALDAGKVINLQGIEGQADGGAAMGTGYALMEDTIIEGGRFKTKNLSTYIIPTALDIPKHESKMVEVLEETGPYGAKGVGEAVCVPITPAITNAVHDAVGVWISHIPATPERVHRLIQRATTQNGHRAVPLPESEGPRITERSVTFGGEVR